MFRRKPAITRSDWHFTAFQNSSENNATFNRSIHYNLVLKRSPRFGSNRSNLSITIFIQYYAYLSFEKEHILIYSPVAFARAFNLATPINLLTHYAKGTPLFFFWTSTAYRVTNSRLFHHGLKPAFQTFPLQYFSLSLNLLYLALEDGSPIFRQVISHRTYKKYLIIKLK